MRLAPVRVRDPDRPEAAERPAEEPPEPERPEAVERQAEEPPGRGLVRAESAAPPEERRGLAEPPPV